MPLCPRCQIFWVARAPASSMAPAPMLLNTHIQNACYHDEFGRSALKAVGIENPEKLGSAGTTLSLHRKYVNISHIFSLN